MLELTAENFPLSPTSRNGHLIDCRPCVKMKQHARDDRTLQRRKEKRVGEHCGNCFGLPWQVVGETCIGCGLAHAEEPRPDFVLWRSWAHAYV
jgi:hypothetical protein